jgi:energy-converting hydrogenase Eha subunit H
MRGIIPTGDVVSIASGINIIIIIITPALQGGGGGR